VKPASIRVLLATAAIAAVACGSSSAHEGAAPVAAPSASVDASPPDGAPPDGGTVDGATVPLTITAFPRIGDKVDDVAKPEGPGLVLMGGGPDVDAAFQWSRTVIAKSATGRTGDVVVLRASGGDAYTSYLYDLASFRSVQTILIPEGAGTADFAAVSSIVSRAEVVFFAGGDQARYVAWKGTPIATAVQDVYTRGGVVGGTSAGCAILGAFAYDAVNTGSSNVTSTTALANPFDARISFTRHMFAFPALADAVTDSHFFERDRMGRLVSFMARQIADGAVARAPAGVLGIGIDEGAAVVIDAQKQGRLLRQRPAARAFIVRGGIASTITAGAPLVYDALRIFRLEDPAATFDFGTWCGLVPSYAVSVDASKPTPFTPASPYDEAAVVATCP
jgi:cyanophycinase